MLYLNSISEKERAMIKNICKFPPSVIQNTMSVSCFVRETDTEVMQKESCLSSNRVILLSDLCGGVCIDGIEYKIDTGMLIFLFKGERVHFKCDGGAYLYIDFEGARADELLDRFDIGVTNRFFDGYDSLIPMWDESLARASNKNVDLAAESVLLYTFSRMDPDDSSGRGIIRRVLNISEQRFTDSDLSIGQIANELFYNPKYLSHKFKEKMGMGYTDYLNSLRIKYAVMLFEHGIDSVKNIAALCGFSDPLYFSSVFKKRMGVSPSEYKKTENVNKN